MKDGTINGSLFVINPEKPVHPVRIFLVFEIASSRVAGAVTVAAR
jgi:hypothetical protein